VNIKEAAAFIPMSERHLLRLIYAKKVRAAKVYKPKMIYVREWDILDDDVYDLKTKNEMHRLNQRITQ